MGDLDSLAEGEGAEVLMVVGKVSSRRDCQRMLGGLLRMLKSAKRRT